MTMPGAFVIFGATGDLARRMLFPSLYFLYADGLLPPDLKIIGAARSAHSDAEFRADVKTWVKDRAAASFSEDAWKAFEKRLGYVAGDATDPQSYVTLREKLNGDTGALFYLSTSPALYIPIVQGLAEQGLTGAPNGVIVEKPIGKSYASCEQINSAIAEHFAESRTFRIDHYLGKETVQNLIALRFANALFEPLWNRHYIDHVQITVAETLGVEGRFGYYNEYGATRDMVQNHLLQLLSFIAMEPPHDMRPESVRSEKVKVLRSLRPIRDSELRDRTVGGQYARGVADGKTVPGYTEEEGGKPSDTETFVALCAHVDNWRWAGVPFYLRTGKRLPTRHSQIVIQFRD
ncbi:MAG: glucose-6-phosphate 1-dehydrogenase, partial [Pseudomonadota bacterium]